MKELKGDILEKILNNQSEEYEVIDHRYKFIGCDHDLWEFQAILRETNTNKFFSVNWFDNYSCNWWELGLYDDMFDLIEVFPKQVLTTIYE